MSDLLLPPDQWAQHEFAAAALGDPRRTKRLVKIGARLAAKPSGTLPQAFPVWAELKAAYGFFDQRDVTFERVLAPHVARTRQSCRQPGTYLLIEDTTPLDYSDHPATADLGVIGDGQGRGFELHTALAVRVEAWTAQPRPEGVLVGLFAQQCRRPRPAPEGETRGQRLQRPRKSQWWAASLQTAGRPPAGSQLIYVADCESDFYEPIERCQQHTVDFVIRSYQDRRLGESDEHLRAALAVAPVLGQTTVEVRARPGHPARTAQVEIRSLRVALAGPWRPGGQRPPLRDVGVVEVREVQVPAAVTEPLHWILLTSLPCATFVEAQRVVGIYTARWWIEEYHKALKSGTKVEESQLERGERLEPLIAVLALVAVRLLSTKLLARSRPEGLEAAAAFGPLPLAMLEAKLGPPKAGWTNAQVFLGIARLGGFLARKHDGLPGWQTIWRGWQCLMCLCEGVETLKRRRKRCG